MSWISDPAQGEKRRRIAFNFTVGIAGGILWGVTSKALIPLKTPRIAGKWEPDVACDPSWAIEPAARDVLVICLLDARMIQDNLLA
jgi:hypothetical protein